METKVGYAFSYRGCGYIYTTLKECHAKIEQLKDKDKNTVFWDQYKYIRIEYAKVTIEDKQLIEYEPLPIPGSNFI